MNTRTSTHAVSKELQDIPAWLHSKPRVTCLALLIAMIPLAITLFSWFELYGAGKAFYGTTGLASPNAGIEFFVIAVGFTCSILLFAMAHSIITSRIRALELAESINDELIKSTENLKKFELAVTLSTDAISITDAKGKIIYVNPSWMKLVGHSRKKDLKKNIRSLLSRQTPSHIRKELETALDQGAQYCTEDLIVKRSNNKFFDALVTLYPIREQKSPVQFYVCTLHDITKRKRMDAAKSEFISLASHQLRTPLTTMKWIFETLNGQKKTMNADQKDMVNDGYACSRIMSDTIQTMLMLSRVESETIQLSVADVNLKEFAEGMQYKFKALLTKKQHAMQVECAEGLTLKTDENILQQICSNLIENAINYTPKGGTISFKIESRKKGVHMSITDNGPGISAHERKRIFTKFFRGEYAIANHTQGTGLGLYLVHSLVTLLDGYINFTSREGQGTTFYLSFPLTPPVYEQEGPHCRR